MKRVLIITYYWPPSGGAGVQRFLKFVKYLPGFDIQPVVLTCSNPTYPIIDPSLAGEIPPGTEVHTARTLEPFRFYSRLSGISEQEAASPSTVLSTAGGSRMQRLSRWIRANLFVPDARLGWVPFARRKAKQLIRRHGIDTVVTTGPPHSTHFIGLWLKRKTGIRWIADFRDPWTDIHYNRALPRLPFTRIRDERMELRALRLADEITVTAPGTARYFSEKTNRDCHIITNGFDPDDFVEIAPISGEASPDGAFIIRHTGSITETSIPDSLLRVLSRFPEDQIRLECIGPVHSDMIRQSERLELGKRLTLLPYRPHREATASMQQSDLNLVVVHRSSDSRMLIPGKIYDYLKAGKPIMGIGPPEGDAASIIERCGMGKVFNYGDEDGPEAWLRELIRSKTEKQSEITGFSPEKTEINRYSRVTLARRFASLLAGDTDKE